MQMWFSQYHTVNVKLDVRIQEQLFQGRVIIRNRCV